LDKLIVRDEKELKVPNIVSNVGGVISHELCKFVHELSFL